MANYEYKTKPFKHQLDALAQSACKKNFAYFMEMGCVDGETEFLSQRGWVPFHEFKLEEWKRPLLVAQAVPDPKDTRKWGYQFVEPEAYICKDADNWVQLEASKGGQKKTDINKNRQGDMILDLTEDHILPINYHYTIKANNQKEGRMREVPSAEAKWLTQAFTMDPSREPRWPGKNSDCRMEYFNYCIDGHLPSPSKYYQEDPELGKLNEWELRFMVAVIADGTYPNITNDKVDFYFAKKRKVDRLKMLAVRAGITLVHESRKKLRRGKKKQEEEQEMIYIVHAIAPARYKKFTSEWYRLPTDKLKAIASELVYWDGSADVSTKRSTYCTIHPECAAFAQYAFMASGTPARIYYNMPKRLYYVYSSWSKYYDRSMLAPEWRKIAAEAESRVPVINNGRFLTGIKKKAYCFRVPSGYLILRRNGHIFISGNSGKTKVMIDNMAMLHEAGHVSAALVLAPKGVYRNWSAKEIPTHLPDRINREILVWDAASTDSKKMKLAKQIKNWDGKTLQIMVFNIESLISEKGRKLIVDFIKRHDGNVFALVDESTCIKNHKAKRTKAAIDLGAQCKVRRIATGSPVTNSPLDLYSQCAFLDKRLLGCGSYYSFKNTYANIEKVQNRQGQHYEKILSYKNLDSLSEKLNKFSFRVTKKECLDLPEKIYMTRDVELTPEQIKLYKEMKDYQFAMLQQDDGFKEMSAQVVLTKFLRLHQILCGTFTDDDGVTHRIPNKRVDALAEVLEETNGKVIIWATYLEDINAIKEMLTQYYGPDSFVTYYGATPSEDRTKAIELFQDESSPVRFFLGNVQTAGRGITLTAASTVVYYSNNFSLELRQQSEDRAHRLGQVNNVTYIDLVARGSLDEKIIQSLISKRNIANEILKDDLDDWISLI